ncbi:olfactomedin-like protein 3 isoform X3 [Lethenteron reissneri]|uniref:olfactomedin-like protein 3 isoform X3 n=1 Tax=Lethenteron reissneri TaxID=7753 RepID=UPI002AB76145|nr:olfactomedin-like protein 3 isoform X3 [Lethenteron reissneri]
MDKLTRYHRNVEFPPLPQDRMDKVYQDVDTVVRQYRDFEVEILSRLETMSHEAQHGNHWWDGMQARLSELEKAMEGMDKRTNCDDVCRSRARPDGAGQPASRAGSGGSSPAPRQEQRLHQQSLGQGGKGQGGSVSLPGLTIKLGSPTKAEGKFANTTLAGPADAAKSSAIQKPRSGPGSTGKQPATASSPAIRIRLAYKRDSECNVTLASVKSVKTVKRWGSPHGAWLKDPAVDVHRLFLFDGTEGDTATAYASAKEFAGLHRGGTATRPGQRRQQGEEETAAGKLLRLPSGWRGTGAVVYAGSVYYHRRGSINEILRYDLAKSAVVGRVLVRGAGRVPVYELAPFTAIDLAVDEHGLWALHAVPAESDDDDAAHTDGDDGGGDEPESGGDLVLSKLDASSPAGGLRVEASWRTPCPSRGAQAAFVVCGSLHVVYAATRDRGAPWVACAFDPEAATTGGGGGGGSDRAHLVPFPAPTAGAPPLSSLHYNRRERQLYAWADGYQALYKLGLAKKTGL